MARKRHNKSFDLALIGDALHTGPFGFEPSIEHRGSWFKEKGIAKLCLFLVPVSFTAFFAGIQNLRESS
jgi:hypothetical protein